MVNQFKNEITGNEKTEVLDRFAQKYVKQEKNAPLMWLALKEKTRLLQFPEIRDLGIPDEHRVYFYLERQRQLYATDLKSVIEFVESFEPWEEVDAYIFDEDMQWLVVITHEDEQILCIGV